MIEPTPKPTLTANGHYVFGVVISNTARIFKRKDGTGVGVLVRHEIALQPGIAVWERFMDPKIDAGVRVEGESAVEFPRLKEFAQVLIRAVRTRIDEHTKQLVIQSGELVIQP